MRDPSKPQLSKHLDADGLPHLGAPMREGDPLYCYLNHEQQAFVVKKFEGKELCFVDSVKVLGNDVGTAEKTRVCISFR